jgi:fatty-acyl-CoA synthase
MSALKMWVRALDGVKNSAHLILPGLIDELAVTYGARIALTDGTDVLTYCHLALRMNRYARWAIKREITGKTVALLMPNCADYVAIWLGLTRVGCTVALLNTNLPHKALTHCLQVSGAQFLITSDFVALVDDARVLAIGEWPLSEMESTDGSALIEPIPSPRDVALYIYTSGTTGLPKATKITHRRITEWSFWFAGMTNATPSDSLYNCLPMYHSIGGIVAIGSMLVVGGCVVIREHFSASLFWRDVVESQCTIFQYIGELCRYLTLAPTSPVEHQHRLRLAVGNGLQANVWRCFQGRFAIPQILEYYAATEGVLSLYNCEGEPGSIGRIPPMLEPYFATRLIRVDQETGEPVRDAAGFCIVCDRDEPGEAISLIKDDRTFDGYNDVEASFRKILRHVFVANDRWYRTGDLMRKNAAGFYFFLDRLGDTFRWKGENVSTTEVANVVRSCPGVLDAIVYGVEVAGNEGRAGMAAVTTTEVFAFDTLAQHVKQHLPSYARPVFVRLCDSLDTTGTFKLAKSRFVAEGYSHTSDPVWRYDSNQFVALEYGCHA